MVSVLVLELIGWTPLDNPAGCLPGPVKPVNLQDLLADLQVDTERNPSVSKLNIIE